MASVVCRGLHNLTPAYYLPVPQTEKLQREVMHSVIIVIQDDLKQNEEDTQIMCRKILQMVSLPKLITLVCEPSNVLAFLPLSKTATEMAMKARNLGQFPYLSSFHLRPTQFISPQKLLTHLLVFSRKPYREKEFGASSLRLLHALHPITSLHPVIYSNVGQLWMKAIPQMLQILDDNTEKNLNQKEWEDRLLQFLSQSLVAIDDDSWLEPLVRVVLERIRYFSNDEEEKGFLYKFFGFTLRTSRNMKLVKIMTSCILQTAHEELQDRELLDTWLNSQKDNERERAMWCAARILGFIAKMNNFKTDIEFTRLGRLVRLLAIRCRDPVDNICFLSSQAVYNLYCILLQQKQMGRKKQGLWEEEKHEIYSANVFYNNTFEIAKERDQVRISATSALGHMLYRVDKFKPGPILRREIYTLLVPLLLSFQDNNTEVVKACGGALTEWTNVIGWSSLTQTFRHTTLSDHIQVLKETCNYLVSTCEKQLLGEFLSQSFGFLKSPQTFLREAAVNFIGLIVKKINMNHIQEDDIQLLQN
ncbi:PREDICTED: uncharacterized protein LOC109392470, partial [Hipposideros armiger]|uniref:Uncharacterized protein LOC109392470 n=1 Tax=Hipposideros armiger TaxID=186990 RepID=A0A8B7SUR5_HIPAR